MQETKGSIRTPGHPELARATKGFPSPEVEADLRETFLASYRPQLIDWLKGFKTSQITNDRLQQILHFLYGIYFYNHISDDRLLNGVAKESVKGKLLQRLVKIPPRGRRSINNLSDWPIFLTAKDVAQTFPDLGLIEIPLNLFSDEPCEEERSYDHGGPHYLAPIGTHYILVGIQEASHLDLGILRSLHYPRGNQPLRDFGQARELEREYSSKYFSHIGYEYAAKIVEATYVRKYLPKLWEESFRKFSKRIFSERRALVI